MNRILVVNVNWIGDVVFTSPVFKALRKTYPQARITCLALPRVKEILESIPEIDDIVLYDERKKDRGLFAKWKLIRHLRQQKFDIAFLLHRSLTRALLVALAGIPKRVGYNEKGRGFFLTHPVDAISCTIHRSDHYLRLVETYGVKVTDRRCRLKVDDSSRQRIQTVFAQKGIGNEEPLVVLHPGGNWEQKRWPLANFALLADRIVEEFGWRVILTGTQDDRGLCQQITKRTQHPLTVLAGEMGLKDLLALLQRARLVISADSGPIHLANSIGGRVIGIFGPTRPEITAPRGSGQRVLLQKDVGCNENACYNLRCPDNLCMRAISVNDVIEAIRQIER